MAKRLAVLGAGTGGTLLADLLGSRLHTHIKSGDIEVLLLGEGFRHYFQPWNLYVASKGAPPDAENRSESDLLNPGVVFVPDPASKVDLSNGEITTAGGSPRLHFAGAFTAGSSSIQVEDGKLRIEKDGTTKKFVNKVFRSFSSSRQALRLDKPST